MESGLLWLLIRPTRHEKIKKNIQRCSGKKIPQECLIYVSFLILSTLFYLLLLLFFSLGKSILYTKKKFYTLQLQKRKIILLIKRKYIMELEEFSPERWRRQTLCTTQFHKHWIVEFIGNQYIFKTIFFCLSRSLDLNSILPCRLFIMLKERLWLEQLKTRISVPFLYATLLHDSLLRLNLWRISL